MSTSKKGVFKNEISPKPKHLEKGEYRRFYNQEEKVFILPNGEEVIVQYASSAKEGCDIYCASCDHWNTVQGTSFLFSITGPCKNCSKSFLKEK